MYITQTSQILLVTGIDYRVYRHVSSLQTDDKNITETLLDVKHNGIKHQQVFPFTKNK